MAKDEFLEEKDVEEKVEEEVEGEAEKEKAAEKIKVGDDEFTQDELKELVGLGKIGKEAEEKFDTKLDKVWPEFTKSRQELKELREAATQREEAETRTKLAEGKELTPEQQKRVAQEEARKLDIMLTSDFDKMYAQRRAGERMTEATEDAVIGAGEKYGIKTTVKDVLEHMAKPESPKVPEKAIKDMFELQIDKWKETELGKKKGAGLVTEETSAAGGKEPDPVKFTRENVLQATREALGQG